MVDYKVVQGKRTKEGKSIWLNVGAAFKRDDKFSLKLDVMPLPNEQGEVWLMLFDRNGGNEIPQKNE
jgi:uncharacterized protein VirK/YbjX